MKKIILIVLVFTMATNAQLLRDDDSNIVTDTVTKLQWDDKDYYEDPGNDSPSKLASNLQDAIDFCENSDLNNHLDWRLPNVNELKTILDISKYSPAIDGNFSSTENGAYWTSTSDIKNINKVFSVNFGDGLSFSSLKLSADDYNVRCVRVDDSD